MIYLANSFSPSMLSRLPLDVEFTGVSREEFCSITDKAVNAVGHPGTVELINSLCGSRLKVNRINMSANVGDEIYITMLTVRLEEGKVLNSEEVKGMYDKGKVKFIKAVIYGPALSELVQCQGVCNEMAYDALAHKAQFG